jgi:hypothetical protein
MNENPLEAGKRKMRRKDEFESEDYDDYDDSGSDRVEAEDINIDEYLSSDDALIIKPKRTITVMTMRTRVSIGSTR